MGAQNPRSKNQSLSSDNFSLYLEDLRHNPQSISVMRKRLWFQAHMTF